jgi:8-oxo-dGTP pyrophosphatase MutT (NUDIX family)
MEKRKTRCCAFIVNDRKELLLIQQCAYDKSIYWWLPGGGLNENENHENGIRREIMEELAVEIDIYDIFKMVIANSARSYQEYFVGISSIKKNQQIILGKYEMDGLLQYKWFNIESEKIYDPILYDKDIMPFIIEAKTHGCFSKLV